MKQLRGPAHKAQNLQKQQAIEQAEAQQAAKRAKEKANKRAATKPLSNSKRARVSAVARQDQDQATRQYQSDAKYLKSGKVIIRLCAELLELEPHGHQASIYRRKK